MLGNVVIAVPASPARIRTIRIDDVVKARHERALLHPLRFSASLHEWLQALEIVAERLGDAGSCDTLQAGRH